MNEDDLLPGLLRSKSKHSQRREPTPPGSRILEDQIKTTKDAIKEIGDQIALIPKRVHLSQQQQTFSLIAGNNRSRSNNQTIKRTSPYLNSREVNHLQQTKGQIRMKIILQNQRLKTSIENLRQDITYYQENEGKIIEILRESKVKITDYKQKLKGKSKKISELIDKNIVLKGQISQLQGKIVNMTSYSEWQAKQLQQLKLEMNSQAVSYNQRIQKLESMIKTYQQGLGNTGSDSHHFIQYFNSSPLQVLSTETISEGTPFSIKQMEARDIESIKYRNFEEEEFNELRDDNAHLKARIRQLQTEMDQLRSESQLREMSAVADQEEIRRRESELREQKSHMIQRSLSMSQQISQKNSSIENLQRELMQIRQYIKQAEEKFFNSQEGYRVQIFKLNAVIDEKNGLLAKQSDRLKETQEYYKKYGEEVNESMQEEQLMARARIQKYEQDLKQLNQDIQASEAEIRRLTALNNQLREFKDQYDQKMHQASKYLQQRQQYQQINNKLRDDLDYYKRQAENNMEYFQGQLTEANSRVSQLEREKSQMHELMSRYAAEIRQLKNQVAQLNHEKNDSMGSHEEIPQVKEQASSQEIAEQRSQTSLINLNDMKDRLQKDEQFIHIFESRPLDEQEELEQASAEQLQEKDALIQHLNKQLNDLRIENLALKEQTNKFTTEVVEANFSLQKQKEQQEELKAAIISRQQDIYAKDIQLQEKQQSLARSERLIQEKEQLLGKVETVVQQNNRQILRLQSIMATFEQNLRAQQVKKQELLHQISKLAQERLQMESKLRKMRQQRENEEASRNELHSSLQLQLNRKKEMEAQLMNSRRLLQSVQSQKQTEKATAQHLAQELERCRSIQKELQEKIRVVNSQKNKLHGEFIARMTENDQFNEQYSRLKSQIEELKHYRKEQLGQIEILKRSTCEIQLAQQTLQTEKDELLRKIAAQEQDLNSKTGSIETLTFNLNKSNLKISELQQFQRKTKIQIEKNLTVLSNIINQQKKQIEKLNFEKEQLITDKQAHIHSVSQFKIDNKKLKQLSQDLEKQLNFEAKSKSLLKIEISKMHDDINEHMEQNKELKDEIAVCQGEIRRLKLENDVLHRQKELLLKANSQLKEEFQNSEKMIKDLSFNIAGIKESLDLSRSSHEEQINQINNLKQSIHKSNQESLSLKLEQEQSKAGIGNLKLQISQIQNRHRSVVQEYEHRIRSTSVKIQQIKQQKQSKIAQLQTNNNNLRNEINQVNHAKENLQTTIKQLNKVIYDNQEQLERLKGQLTEQRDIVSSKDLVILSLEKNIAVKKEQAEQMSRILYDQQERLQILNGEIGTQMKRQEILQIKIADLTKQQQQMKQALQAEIVRLGDDLQISRKMLQQAEQDHQLKANKLSKEITSYKMMLDQNQKENSFQLEQSNRSITEINNKLKEYIQTIRQKDTQLKEAREHNSQMKEQYEKIKIISSRFEEEKVQWEQVRSKYQERQHQLHQGVRINKNQLNSFKATINKISSELQKSNNELNNSKTMLQQLQISSETLAKQKALIEEKLEKIQFQKLRVESRLQTIALQRMQFQTQCEQLQQQNQRLQNKTMEQSQEMQIQAIRLAEEKKELQQKNTGLALQIQRLREEMKMMQKEHQTRMEDLSLEKRQNLLDVQQKHEQDIQHYLQEIQQCRLTIDNLKERDKNTLEEKENLVKKLKNTQKLLKDSQNQIGELTDKILQLTQQNNESNAIIQDLRNSLVDKGNQIEECRQAISRLQQQLQEMRSQRSPINSSGSIPLSIQNEQKLNDAFQFIQRLTETNKQLELQLKEKIRTQKELNDRIQKIKERQTRQRHSSCDSFPNRSKIFDEKSQNLVTKLEQTKIKLSEAEAYIHLLQQENKHPEQAAAREDGGVLEQRILELKKQVQSLKMVNEQQQAYISQLQNNSNLAESVHSRRSAIPSEKFQQKQKVQYGQNVITNQKIYLLISFVENYTLDNKSRDKQEQLKSQLSHPVLEELLSTIFYRLQKSSGIIKDNERVIADLHEDYDSMVDDLHNEKENHKYLKSRYNQLEINFKEYQKNCQELLTNKMTLEADIAECRSYVEQLQNKLMRYQRGKEQPKKEGLQILEEQNESSSDSMMSESVESEMPSSLSQSKDFKSSMDIRAKNKANGSKRGMVLTKSNNLIEDQAINAQFLKKCLLMINELQTEVERIEAELQQKNRILNQHLNQSVSKDEIINKLSIVQTKIRMNDREMKNHFQTSEMQVAAIIKGLIKYRKDKDQYGLQNQSRKKIDEYLNLLEQQLQKSSKFYEEEGFKMHQNSRKNDSPLRLGGSLNEIKQEAVNEDKGSSIVSPKNGQVLRSFSNSQGVTQSLEIIEVKHNYNQALRQLHEVHDELTSKDQMINNMQQRYRLIQQEVFMMFDDIRLSFVDDQYLNDQIDKIKKFMTKYMHEEAQLSKIKESRQKIQEEKVNILVESNPNNSNNQSESKKHQNPFEYLLKLNEAELNEMAESVSNQNLKEFHRRIEQIINERFDDCLDFLNTEKSLIANILKIRNDEAHLQYTMNRLASKLTKQEITEIITNSHNRIQANKTLTIILREDGAKSIISDQHDFSPNANKIQQIRNRIYNRHTELSLVMQNQLLEILAAPTRQEFYELIEQFYKILKDFEDRFQTQLSEKDERSEKHSIRLKRVLEGPRQELQFSRQLVNHVQMKHQKNRSSSYNANMLQDENA